MPKSSRGWAASTSSRPRTSTSWSTCWASCRPTTSRSPPWSTCHGDAVDPLTEVVREEWGHLVALLLARYRRLDLVEDALGDAVEAAARTWPTAGVPDNPAAWLHTTAGRRIIDRLRSEATAQ